MRHTHYKTSHFLEYCVLVRLKVQHPTVTSLYFICFGLEELQQKEQQWRQRCEELQVQVQQLQEDRNELHDRLKGNHAQEGTFHSLPLKCERFH